MTRDRLISIIELAILVVEKSGKLKRGELPRLSQVLLGNMMFTQDRSTAASIALDCGSGTGELVYRIQNGWGQTRPSIPPSTLGQGLELCHDVVSSVHKTSGPEGYRLIRGKVHRKRWADVAREFEGRDAISVRDDYYELLDKNEKVNSQLLQRFNTFLKDNVVDTKTGVKILLGQQKYLFTT